MTAKLRPYDEPPKRRMTLIPRGPDNAASLFLAAAVVWFFVATGLHHRGIGTTLMATALADARRRGVRSLVAEVLATNHLMLQVFTEAGATLSGVGQEVRVTLPVSPGRGES